MIYTPSEISKLKDSATRFFTYARNMLIPAYEMTSIDHVSQLANYKVRSADVRDSLIASNRVKKVFFNNYTAFYSVDENFNMQLYKVIDSRSNLVFLYNDYSVSAVYRQKDGKILEILSSLGLAGYNYCKPLTPLPQVLLTISGSFRGLN